MGEAHYTERVYHCVLASLSSNGAQVPDAEPELVQAPVRNRCLAPGLQAEA